MLCDMPCDPPPRAGLPIPSRTASATALTCALTCALTGAFIGAFAAALTGFAAAAAADPADRWARAARMERGCYWMRGREHCGSYCYVEVDGRRYCRARSRFAFPQGVIEEPVVEGYVPVK